ncbi:MAG: hypothetical protein ACR2H2_02665, partial [Solirubrobacteraceae bacterium]
MARAPLIPFPGERGQATVELVALLPLIAVLAGVMWQAAVAGQAVWLAGSATRADAPAREPRDRPFPPPAAPPHPPTSS